jgi:hypothetical protein
MTQPLSFLAGVIAMGYFTAGVFFLRFWVRTRDGLFLAFAAAFTLMALTTALVTVLDVPREEQSGFFLLRLAAFLLIIAAVLAKNFKTRRERD